MKKTEKREFGTEAQHRCEFKNQNACFFSLLEWLDTYIAHLIHNKCHPLSNIRFECALSQTHKTYGLHQSTTHSLCVSFYICLWILKAIQYNCFYHSYSNNNNNIFTCNNSSLHNAHQMGMLNLLCVGDVCRRCCFL